MNPHTPREFHFGSWSPGGLSNLQRAIVGVKTQWLEELFISMKIFWNVNILNGLALPIWTSKTQVMAKRRAGNQIDNLTSDQ
jgi:hypothetical protein